MTYAIENDTLHGLPSVGADIGGFLTALVTGLGAFIIVLGVFTGVAKIVAAIANVVRDSVHM